MRPGAGVRAARRQAASRELTEKRRWWRAAAIRGGCAMCHAFPLSGDELATLAPQIRKIEGHHLLPQRDLKRHGYADRLWDERNGMGLCELHHHRHERYVQRVPRDLLSESAYEFADELGLGWLIDREYP